MWHKNKTRSQILLCLISFLCPLSSKGRDLRMIIIPLFCYQCLILRFFLNSNLWLLILMKYFSSAIIYLCQVHEYSFIKNAGYLFSSIRLRHSLSTLLPVWNILMLCQIRNEVAKNTILSILFTILFLAFY